MTEAEFAELKEDHEHATKLAERARGALQQLERQLRKEFGCDVRGARKLLAKLEAQQTEIQENLERATKAYVRLRKRS